MKNIIKDTALCLKKACEQQASIEDNKERYKSLMSMAEKLECHEVHETLGICACGIEATTVWVKDHPCFNKAIPQFSISPLPGYISLVEVLKLLGVYEEFISWHHISLMYSTSYEEGIWGNRYCYKSSAEILLNIELLVQAIKNFLKGRE